MARTKIEVDAKKLQSVINQVESAAEGGKFPTREALFNAVLTSKWATDHVPPLSKSIISSRFKSLGLTAKTPAAKPGRPKGSKNKPADAVEAVTVPASGADIEEVVETGTETDID